MNTTVPQSDEAPVEWSEFTSRCMVCERLFRIPADAMEQARKNFQGADEDIAATFDLCSKCAAAVASPPGEFVIGTRFGCPHCESENVEQVTALPTHYPVTAWDEDGTPIEFGERRVFDELAEPSGVYFCRTCDKAFERPKRLDTTNQEDHGRYLVVGPDRVAEYDDLEGAMNAAREWEADGDRRYVVDTRSNEIVYRSEEVEP